MFLKAIVKDINKSQKIFKLKIFSTITDKRDSMARGMHYIEQCWVQQDSRENTQKFTVTFYLMTRKTFVRNDLQLLRSPTRQPKD